MVSAFSLLLVVLDPDRLLVSLLRLPRHVDNALLGRALAWGGGGGGWPWPRLSWAAARTVTTAVARARGGGACCTSRALISTNNNQDDFLFEPLTINILFTASWIVWPSDAAPQLVHPEVLEELGVVPALGVLSVHTLEVEQARVLYHSPEHPEDDGDHRDEHQHQAPGVSHGHQTGHWVSTWTSAETISKHLITQTQSFPKNKRHTSYVTLVDCIDWHVQQ